jgi:hypothetical protein
MLIYLPDPLVRGMDPPKFYGSEALEEIPLGTVLESGSI